MTCIATDGKAMAGDGLIVADHSLILSWTFEKVVRLGDGRVYGAAGIVDSMINARDWLNAGAPGGDDRPKLDHDTFEAMILDHEGRVLWFDDSCVFVPYDPPFAIGVGSDIAIALMRMGQSPEAAVHEAIRNHATVGGHICYQRPGKAP